MVPPRRSRTVPWGIVGLTSGAVVVLGSVVALRARSADPTPEPARTGPGGVSSAAFEPLPGDTAPPSGATGAAQPAPGDARAQILSKTSLEEAIAVARPQMVNTVGRVDTGSALLALWAAGNLTWDALEAVPATSAAMFHKDPDSERGKRLCVSGIIAEIRAEKSLAARLTDDRALPLIAARPYPAAGGTEAAHTLEPASSAFLPLDQPAQSEWTIPNDGKVFIATIREKQTSTEAAGRTFRKPNRDELVVEIIAGKSTGQLVNRSEARACGILTGVTLPSTGSNTLPPDVTLHRIVGLFDLPQNRTR